MTPRDFYHKHLKTNRAILERVACDAGTSFRNFQQIAICNGCVSSKLAERLEKASAGEMTIMEILFPEKFKETSAA